MSFVSISFMIFLGITLVVFYLIPNKCRIYLLLLASYIFYGSYDFKLLIILLFVTFLTWIGGKYIYYGIISNKRTEIVYRLFFLLNILILIIYKYSNFCIDNYNAVAGRLGLNIVTTRSLIVPIGLSFYIFQSSSYLGDIKKRKLEPVGFVKYALFVSFFPTLLSGPIQKARDILPQFNFEKRVSMLEFKKGFRLFIYGLLVKIYVADKIDKFISPVYYEYNNYLGLQYLIAALFFSVQIYADFSAYTDMARGVSLMLGIDTRDNFDRPYLSTDLSSFWKRWHMSLNAWFVEYIYIPLGGSKKGQGRKYINEMIVFLISGLWHGASWHFVIWGGLNGILQIVGEITANIRQSVRNIIGLKNEYKATVYIRRAIVFLLITFTWVFFKCGSVSMACDMLAGIVRINPLGLLSGDIYAGMGNTSAWFSVVIIVFAFLCIQSNRTTGKISLIYDSQPEIIIYIITIMTFVALVFGILGTIANPNTEFIYFEF